MFMFANVVNVLKKLSVGNFIILNHEKLVPFAFAWACTQKINLPAQLHAYFKYLHTRNYETKQLLAHPKNLGTCAPKSFASAQLPALQITPFCVQTIL